ncbi:transcription antitermination factor NusB [Lyngbya sp. PCC 8106]|uniref:transcription antitermination factor NusB n=1 Tax=Lyngbya sp. (strain PCC 8106) TaxID=313612 RepID=UPI0000EAD1AE|nr:transcription antitermination factor NusB [Lyngbya sp. PCC 8106]EAW38272.1 transcription antitermination protein NusB [Lyngbya sp. PCC 8106]
MQARRSARELALLGISQLPSSPEKLATQQIQDIMLAVVRTLANEGQESLETAMVELQRGSDRLAGSQFRTNDLQSARAMVQEAIELTQTAINRLGIAAEFPELIQLSRQEEVAAYAIEILTEIHARRTEIDEILNQALVDWQINRLPRIDRDILRIAVTELLYLGTQEQVALNEAIELAKRYSDEDSYRFINGVLRRVLDQLKADAVVSN